LYKGRVIRGIMQMSMEKEKVMGRKEEVNKNLWKNGDL
jgi:hypothetical protein